MLSCFYPKMYEKSIYMIDYGKLYKDGIRFLIFDIDNTLAPCDVIHPSNEVMNLISRLKKMGFCICLLSNNKSKRVEIFNNKLGLHAVYRAKKPSRKGLYRALSLMKGDKEKTALIGDQMFTDVWCGNRAGVFTILVKPMSNKDEWTVRLKRLPEKIVFNRYIRFMRKAL